MGKTYRNVKTDPMLAAEPACAYGVSNSRPSSKSVSKKKSVMANTVSVDEYFDQLIAHVHEDYANL